MCFQLVSQSDCNAESIRSQTDQRSGSKLLLAFDKQRSKIKKKKKNAKVTLSLTLASVSFFFWLSQVRSSWSGSQACLISVRKKPERNRARFAKFSPELIEPALKHEHIAHGSHNGFFVVACRWIRLTARFNKNNNCRNGRGWIALWTLSIQSRHAIDRRLDRISRLSYWCYRKRWNWCTGKLS